MLMSTDEYYDSLAEVRESLGYVNDYSSEPKGEGQTPPHSYEILKLIYFNDPVISTSIDFKAETVLSNGYKFEGKNERAVKRAYERFDELNMFEVLLNFLKQAEWYGDSYLEPKLNPSGTLSEVWPLDSSITRIDYDEHGKVRAYLQSTDNGKDKVIWEPDELLHFRANWFGSNVYSWAPSISISKQLSNRSMLNEYILQIFKNLPPKMVHILKQASKEQYKSYKQSLLAGRSNLNQDLVVRAPSTPDGDVKITQNVVDFTKGGLMEVARYVREEVLARLRVPPVLLGLANETSRTEPQLFAFETHIRMIQNRVAKFINDKLMPLLGLSNVKMYFPPVMVLTEEKYLSNARAMIDMGLTAGSESNHPAINYLRDKGFSLANDVKVVSEKTVKDIDLMPSRKRKGMKEGREQASNKELDGDSPESRDKVLKSQVRSALESGDFELYWENRNQ